MLPSIENILNFSEEYLLQADTTRPVDLPHLDDIVERASSRGYTRGVDVSKVVTALRSREIYYQLPRGTWILAIVLAFAGHGILWFIWFKNTSNH